MGLHELSVEILRLLLECEIIVVVRWAFSPLDRFFPEPIRADFRPLTPEMPTFFGFHFLDTRNNSKVQSAMSSLRFEVYLPILLPVA